MKTFIFTLIGIIIIFAEGKPLEETTSTQNDNLQNNNLTLSFKEIDFEKYWILGR